MFSPLIFEVIMSKNHILVFETLKEAIDNLADEQANLLYLNAMTTRAIKNAKNLGNEFEVDKISRAELHAITYNIKLDNVEKEKIKKNLNIENFKKFLINLIHNNESLKTKFRSLGFFPVIKNSEDKGRGNERKLWLDIKEYDDDVFETENKKEITDKSIIKYIRQENTLVKKSFIMNVIFDKNNELKMFSIRGILFILYFLLFFAFIIIGILYFIFSIFLFKENMLTSILYGIFSLILILSFYELLIPLNKLITNRVIKAPHFFISLNQENAEIEFYRSPYKKGSNTEYNIARITEIRSVCPICTAPILLMNGKPDQSAPLVGRCIEAPHAHIYSFDRVLMVGYFLGHPEYLKEQKIDD